MRSLRVLIAEDDSLTALNLKEQLQAMGHDVVSVVATGREAVDTASVQKLDLITMDISMPDMDGLTAARLIHDTDLVAIIMITGNSDPTAISEAAESGVMSYLVKPIGEKDLLASIEVAMQRFNEMQSIRNELKTVKETLETRKVVERAKGILMKRQRLSEQEAFTKMQKESQKKNKKLIDVAQAIIEAEPFL
ncbi:MAG: response regulator [Armatimonadetes bacterium]|nr:response regulator [Armatimonadota bacterium]